MLTFQRLACVALLGLLPAAAATAQSHPRPTEKPLMKDFIGINTHTTQHRPGLYAPAALLLRDYHTMAWDLGRDSTSNPSHFPMSRPDLNVNWEKMYGEWVDAGAEINMCIKFAYEEPEWKNIPADAEKYGRAIGSFFGENGTDLVTSIQIGNEPGSYSDQAYHEIFKHMATGIRQTAPEMLIVTCFIQPNSNGNHWKTTATLDGLEDLYDVLAIHAYPVYERHPTWKQGHPERPDMDFLSRFQKLIDWRDANAPDKQVWVTEFGYGASTKIPAPGAANPQWRGVTDQQQAQYITRGFLILSGMDIDRAYLFWFNDDDTPAHHGSSGITRHYQPKPSYWAMCHLQQTLGAYRFHRAVEKKADDLYVYEYTPGSGDGPVIWAVWSPTGSDRETDVTLTVPGKVTRGEVMPVEDGDAPQATFQQAEDKLTLRVTETPTYLWIE